MATIKWLDLEIGAVKVQLKQVEPGQTWSNLINGFKTVGFGETKFNGKVFNGLLGVGKVVRKYQQKNNFARERISC